MEIKEKVLEEVIEEILEKRFRRKVKQGSIPTVIFSRDEYKIGIDKAVDLTLAEVNKIINEGIKDMKFMIKQGKYKTQADNGLSVFKKLKEQIGLK